MGNAFATNLTRLTDTPTPVQVNTLTHTHTHTHAQETNKKNEFQCLLISPEICLLCRGHAAIGSPYRKLLESNLGKFSSFFMIFCLILRFFNFFFLFSNMSFFFFKFLSNIEMPQAVNLRECHAQHNRNKKFFFFKFTQKKNKNWSRWSKSSTLLAYVAIIKLVRFYFSPLCVLFCAPWIISISEYFLLLYLSENDLHFWWVRLISRVQKKKGKKKARAILITISGAF